MRPEDITPSQRDRYLRDLHAEEYRAYLRKLMSQRVPGPGEEELWQGPGTRFIRRIRKNAS
jgi:hypothetical protein